MLIRLRERNVRLQVATTLCQKCLHSGSAGKTRGRREQLCQEPCGPRFFKSLMEPSTDVTIRFMLLLSIEQ